MSTNVTEYSARFPLPTMLVRGRENVLTLKIENAGTGVTPSSGTITITEPDGTELVSAAALDSPLGTRAPTRLLRRRCQPRRLSANSG